MSEPEPKADPTWVGGEGKTSAESGTPAGSDRIYLLLLFGVWLFHALNNVYYLATTDTPPSYDCAFHLQLSLHTYQAFVDFDSENYLEGIYFSTGFYPFFGYAATVPFYAAFGLGQSAAAAGNILFLAGLIFSTYSIGRILHSSIAGFVSACLLAFFPFVFGLSRVFYIENGLLAVTAFSFLCLLRSEKFANRKWSLLFGLSVGLGMMTKWTFATQLFLPVAWAAATMTIELHRTGNERRLSSNPFGWLLLALGLGICLCALAVDRSPLWLFAGTIPSVLGAALLLPDRAWRGRLLNIGSAGLVAAAICYPWYIRHWDLVTGVAGHFFDPENTGQAASWTMGALLYYPFAMQSNLLGPALFILFLFSLLVFPWRQFVRYGAVFAWILGAYLVISNIPVRDPRYISPFLPGVALIMGISFASLPRPWVRWTFYGFAALAAVWQFGMMTFEWPLPRGNHWRIGPHGHFYSLWNHGVYGTGRERHEDWPHRRIANDFKEVAFEKGAERGEKPRLRCLIDHPSIHQGVFEHLAMTEGGDWTSVFDRHAERLDRELRRWNESEALLFPAEPILGDLYRMKEGRHPSEFNPGPTSFIGVRFPVRREHTLPTGEKVVLAARGDSNFLDTPPKQGVQMGERTAILAGGLDLIRREGKWVLRATTHWKYLDIDNWPSGRLDRVWIDLYTPGGILAASKDFSFPQGLETGQEEEMQFDWILPENLEGAVLQVALELGGRTRGESSGKVEGGEPRFFERVIFVGE